MRKDEDIKRIWFTADLHLLHRKIVDITKRPISKEDHEEWLISRINSRVGKKDEIYFLGDIALASKKKTEPLLDKINGNKYLVLGNHDDNIKNSTRFIDVKSIKNFNFNSPSYSNIHIVLCHYPIASWERKIHGAMHLYGHVHGRFENTGLSIDIGVDSQWCNYYPLNLEEVLNIMNEKSDSYGKSR